MKDKVTIGACWDGRDFYSYEYVNRLYTSVSRMTTHPFDFVLYVGPQAPLNPDLNKINKKIKVFQTGLDYWWCGMPFWAAKPMGVWTDTLLYIDLDVVIVGSLDDIIEFPSDHAYMKDYPADNCPKGKENDGNASISLIRNGAGADVWEMYDKAGRPQWNPHKPPANRKFPLAAQGIMNALKIPHDVFPEEWVASYKLQVLPKGIPEDCRAVSFHGRPKPHECKEKWILENWI